VFAHLQTGEEAEKALVDMKCKLYRFDPESSEWKERGIGQVNLENHFKIHLPNQKVTVAYSRIYL